ncbi:MAG: right-handed parallel beta-helix repeat-containing protein [Clostridia bacterium]
MYSNVKNFGAIGNGIADDTDAILGAIQNAVDETGVVYFPPGTYMIRPIEVPSHITLMGNSSWSYLGSRTDKDGNSLDPGYKGRTIISPINADGKALLDLNGKCGTRIIGLTFDGRDIGTGFHCIYTHNIGIEQHICVEDCRIESFSGSGIRLDRVWVFSIRRNIIMRNGEHGIDCTSGYDGWIIDNQLTGNKGAGLYASGEDIPGKDEFGRPIFTGMATVMVTANRVEWNKTAGVSIKASNTMQFTGNSIDHNFGPGFYIHSCVSGTISGNVIRSSSVDLENNLSCQIYLEECKGVSVTGNSFWGWYERKEYNLTKVAPYYNFTLKNNRDCVITGNAAYEGCGIQSVLDLGGNVNIDYSNNPSSFPDAEKYGLTK